MNERDKSYDFIRAFAVVLIVIWHFWTTCDFGAFLPLKTICEATGMSAAGINEGGIGVALFLILSGAVLTTRYRDECKVGPFFKRRVLRIFIPLWISYCLIFIIALLLNKTAWSDLNIGVLFSFLGFDYFAGAGLPTFWLVGEWFTTVIVIMYILFPLLRLMLRKIPIFTTIIITVIFVLNVRFQILTYGDGWFSITNSLMMFWIGMLIGYYKPKFKWPMFYAGLIGIVLTLIFAKQLNGLMFYLTNLLFSTSLFMVLGVINYSNQVIGGLSKYNFEIYLLHHRILIWMIPLLQFSFSSIKKSIFIFIVIFWFIYGCSKLLNLLILGFYKLVEWLKNLYKTKKDLSQSVEPTAK